MKLFNSPKSSDTDGAEETKKCHDCLAEIPKAAKKCSHCGTKQKKEVNKKHALIGGAFIIILIFLFSLGGDDNGSQQASQQQAGVTDSQAHIMAQNYVEQVLKSPSTADFPSFDYRYFDLGDDKHKVVSYVDAQNSFGAEVRSDYSVILSHNGGDWADINNWTLHEIILDGEVVYSEPAE
ncbi:MAG: hypothetical protein WDZ75_01345 [Candidatus Paceibacterota bacterium]